MRIFVAGKLVQRTWQDDSGNKRHTVEIQVVHVGPDLQFATAEVRKAQAGDSAVPAEQAG
jgi:single-strand DNA-binding protein